MGNQVEQRLFAQQPWAQIEVVILRPALYLGLGKKGPSESIARRCRTLHLIGIQGVAHDEKAILIK